MDNGGEVWCVCVGGQNLLSAQKTYYAMFGREFAQATAEAWRTAIRRWCFADRSRDMTFTVQPWPFGPEAHLEYLESKDGWIDK